MSLQELMHAVAAQLSCLNSEESTPSALTVARAAAIFSPALRLVTTYIPAWQGSVKDADTMNWEPCLTGGDHHALHGGKSMQGRCSHQRDDVTAVPTLL